MLSVHHLEVFYGGIQALHGATLEVPKGRIVTLIGANGAGKSTLLRAIAGLVPSRRGEIKFESSPILGRPAHVIARAGLILIPEGRRIFPNLSVEENLSMATFAARRLGDMAGNAAGIVAIELLAAAQGIEFRKPLATSPRLAEALALVREEVAFYDHDRYFAPDIAAIQRLVEAGVFHRFVPGLLPSHPRPR